MLLMSRHNYCVQPDTSPLVTLVLVRYSHTVEVLTVPDCLQDGGREEFGILSCVVAREGLCVCCTEIV